MKKRNHRLTPRLLLALGLCATACQSYPFEVRPTRRSQGRRVTEVVKTVTPTDILFVIDNSGSMVDETTELRNNIRSFVERLSQTDTDYQIGIVTTDVDCNLPDIEEKCQAPETYSYECCGRFNNALLKFPPCRTVRDGSGKAAWSDCDGGRLRSAQPEPRGSLPMYFENPTTAAAREALIENVDATLGELGCRGSATEAGLEAARRAVSCSLNTGCSDAEQDVRDLNGGFIRDDADLVVIFMSDEEDCSFTDPVAYLRPRSALEASHQLCSQDVCYAHLLANTSSVNCSGFSPAGAFPTANTVDSYVDALVALKGGDVGRVRAAGIVSAVKDGSARLGYRASHCVATAAGPANTCGCWGNSPPLGEDQASRSRDLYCNLTDTVSVGERSGPTYQSVSCIDQSETELSGCAAVPSSRYVAFLETLSQRRVDAGHASDTLIDSICRKSYAQTLYQIVNTVILSSCFDVSDLPEDPASIRVVYNGEVLEQLDATSTAGAGTTSSAAEAVRGYIINDQRTKICLHGELSKDIGDELEVYVKDEDP